MRYRSRHVVNLAIFAGALLFVLYLNFSGSPRGSENVKGFAWTTIRYQTISSHLPLSRGICPGLRTTDKPALVISRVVADGTAEWLQPLAHKYHLCVYNADGPADTESTHLQLPANRGHEAMAYLTFLIDNYDHIPAAGAVFVHGSRFAWHNDAPFYDNAAALHALNLSSALAPTGYHNLRCDWSASTCDPSYAPPQGSFETAFNAYFSPWDARAKSDALYASSLSSLFGGSHHLLALQNPDSSSDTSDGVKNPSGSRPLRPGRSDAVRAQCCAQFAVARANIWQHSRAEYSALRQWLLDGHEGAAPADDRIAGRILSYIWHILFLPRAGGGGGEGDSEVRLDALNRMACPRADECYCRLYGRCDLKNCGSPGRCAGQYVLPPDYALPEDWAERVAAREKASQRAGVS